MNKLDKHIRCECGKFYGINLFRQKRVCNRCKAEVKARGELKNGN